MKTTRRQILLVTVLACALILPAAAGLFSPSGDSDDEKRAKVRTDRDEILAMLYDKHPEAKDKIEKAVGYATFNNMNVNLLLLSSGRGYGLIMDQKTQKETFMCMGSLGGGLGLGIKDFRAVFIFHDADVMKKFVESGWQFNAEADATAKSDEKGGAAAKEGGADTGGNTFEIYQITKSGIALQATIAGTKYWKDDELNATNQPPAATNEPPAATEPPKEQ